MNSSGTKTPADDEVLRFTFRPRLQHPSFIVGWASDPGGVSRLVAQYLVKASNSRSFCQIEPAGFYSLSGVTVNDDVAQFPQGRFFCNETGDVMVLQADEPQSHKYEFLSAVLDLAERYANAQALYTINGITSLTPHTAVRGVSAFFNDAGLWRRLRQFVPANMDWQGPPDTSTYLLWLAGKRGLPGASLWVEVPFYLAGHEDFQSAEAVLSLLAMMLGRDLELRELDQLVADQNEKLAHLQDDPEIEEKIRTLEEGESLDRQEQLELIEAVDSALKGTA
jgi:proteasome assembly chaperone (PAC2) family protein